MAKNDAALLDPGDFASAMALLTRLPVPDTAHRGAAAAWAWPLAGAVVACGGAGVAGIALWLGLPATIAAALALAAQMLLTGALHEDGLADTADGLWGGHDKAQRLAIMHDSRIGTYGVLALLLVTLLRWQALAALFATGWVLGPLVAAAMLSRAPMALVMAWLENARGTGLAQSVGQPSPTTAGLALAVALAAALVLTGWAGIGAAVLALLAAWGMAALAQAKIGGQTGDVLGAVQQLAEVAALMMLAAN